MFDPNFVKARNYESHLTQITIHVASAFFKWLLFEYLLKLDYFFMIKQLFKLHEVLFYVEYLFT